jgi:hypothetical protein
MYIYERERKRKRAMAYTREKLALREVLNVEQFGARHTQLLAGLEVQLQVALRAQPVRCR